MSPLISAGTVAAFRALVGQLMEHTYTRTAVTQGAEDTWFETADTSGTPATGVACFYQAADRPRRDEAGNVILRGPTLTVAHGDPLARGDLVSAITDSEGVVLLAGPVRVVRVEPLADAGPTLLKEAVLQGAEVSE